MKLKSAWNFIEALMLFTYILNVEAESTDKRLDILERLFRFEVNLLRMDMEAEKSERDIIDGKLDSVIKQVNALSTTSKEEAAAETVITSPKCKPKSESGPENKAVCTPNTLERLIKGLQDEKMARKKQNQIFNSIVEETRSEIANERMERRKDISFVNNNVPNNEDTVDTLINKMSLVQDDVTNNKVAIDALSNRTLHLEESLDNIKNNARALNQSLVQHVFKNMKDQDLYPESMKGDLPEAEDCRDIRDKGTGIPSGNYEIRVDIDGDFERLNVYCDMETDGGGWTVFQKRYDGSVDFYQNFREYENGFGSLEGEFWLGLKWVYHMTKKQQQEMRIDLVDTQGRETFSKYSTFHLGPPQSYSIHVSGYSGNAWDRLGKGDDWHNGKSFTTKDKDQDTCGRNCAEQRHGGYWYYCCTASNLNGKYRLSAGDSSSMRFYWRSPLTDNLSASQMKFRKK